MDSVYPDETTTTAISVPWAKRYWWVFLLIALVVAGGVAAAVIILTRHHSPKNDMHLSAGTYRLGDTISATFSSKKPLKQDDLRWDLSVDNQVTWTKITNIVHTGSNTTSFVCTTNVQSDTCFIRAVDEADESIVVISPKFAIAASFILDERSVGASPHTSIDSDTTTTVYLKWTTSWLDNATWQVRKQVAADAWGDFQSTSVKDQSFSLTSPATGEEFQYQVKATKADDSSVSISVTSAWIVMDDLVITVNTKNAAGAIASAFAPGDVMTIALDTGSRDWPTSSTAALTYMDGTNAPQPIGTATSASFAWTIPLTIHSTQLVVAALHNGKTWKATAVTVSDSFLLSSLTVAGESTSIEPGAAITVTLAWTGAWDNHPLTWTYTSDSVTTDTIIEVTETANHTINTQEYTLTAPTVAQTSWRLKAAMNEHSVQTIPLDIHVGFLTQGISIRSTGTIIAAQSITLGVGYVGDWSPSKITVTDTAQTLGTPTYSNDSTAKIASFTVIPVAGDHTVTVHQGSRSMQLDFTAVEAGIKTMIPVFSSSYHSFRTSDDNIVIEFQTVGLDEAALRSLIATASWNGITLPLTLDTNATLTIVSATIAKLAIPTTFFLHQPFTTLPIHGGMFGILPYATATVPLTVAFDVQIDYTLTTTTFTNLLLVYDDSLPPEAELYAVGRLHECLLTIPTLDQLRVYYDFSLTLNDKPIAHSKADIRMEDYSVWIGFYLTTADVLVDPTALYALKVHCKNGDGQELEFSAPQTYGLTSVVPVIPTQFLYGVCDLQDDTGDTTKSIYRVLSGTDYNTSGRRGMACSLLDETEDAAAVYRTFDWDSPHPSRRYRISLAQKQLTIGTENQWDPPRFDGGGTYFTTTAPATFTFVADPTNAYATSLATNVIAAFRVKDETNGTELQLVHKADGLKLHICTSLEVGGHDKGAFLGLIPRTDAYAAIWFLAGLDVPTLAL